MTSTLPPALHVVCASTVPAVYVSATRPSDPLRHLTIAIDGRFALVGWLRRETGGMSVLERRNRTWCRVADGGGALGEPDLVGFDGIDRATAHRLFARLRNAGDRDDR